MAHLIEPTDPRTLWPNGIVDKVGFGNCKSVHVDVSVICAKLAPLLPGTWTVIREGERSPYSGNVLDWLYVERKEDGLRLAVDSSTNYHREAAIKISLARYQDCTGSSVDIRYLKGGQFKIETPSARVSLKRTPAIIAKDIIRRVINPALPILDLIKAAQRERHDQELAKTDLYTQLLAIDGVKDWSSAHDTSKSVVRVGPCYITVRPGYSRIESFNIDDKDIIAFAKFIAERGME
jgi:hypothetical protein